MENYEFNLRRANWAKSFRLYAQNCTIAIVAKDTSQILHD